jgi:acyl dehydratase
MLYYEDIELDTPRRSADYVVDKDALLAFAKQYPMGLIGSSVQSYAILTKLQAEMPGAKPAVISGLGIDEWRTPNPLKPGDTVHAVCYVEAKRESSSKPQLGILTSVSTLMNQRGDVILTYKSTGLVMKRPPG